MYRKTEFVKKYFYGDKVIDLNEYVISLGTSCNLGCEYCYLKFVKTPVLPVVYKNIDKLQVELEQTLSSEEKIFYFNCGETTDSLLTEQHLGNIVNIINILSSLVKKYNKEVYIELRTKTLNVYKLVLPNFDERIKIVYCISLTPEEIRKKFELNTADIFGRIKSLKYASNNNLLIGLRFEPIIIYPVFGISYNNIKNSIKYLLQQYEKIISFCYENMYTKNLHSISISCIRFTKKQFKKLIKQKSKLCFPEMVLCPDKKYRYSRPIRVEIYEGIINTLKKFFSDKIVEKIFLSTEFDYIWKDCKIQPKILAI